MGAVTPAVGRAGITLHEALAVNYARAESQQASGKVRVGRNSAVDDGNADIPAGVSAACGNTGQGGGVPMGEYRRIGRRRDSPVRGHITHVRVIGNGVELF